MLITDMIFDIKFYIIETKLIILSFFSTAYLSYILFISLL